MPGPVSDSYPGPSELAWRLKQTWRRELAEEGFRYFVLKAEDLFEALNEREIRSFNKMLQKIEKHRIKRGKPASRAFWVFARHWNGADRVKDLMQKLFGHKIGEPYHMLERQEERR